MIINEVKERDMLEEDRYIQNACTLCTFLLYSLLTKILKEAIIKWHTLYQNSLMHTML